MAANIAFFGGADTTGQFGLWATNGTAAGEVDTWIMANGHQVGGVILSFVSTAWQFAGISDVNGDGTSDVTWRNSSTGEVDTWLIANDHVSGGNAIGTASTAWTPLVIPTA
jgi:serralysin